MKQEKLLLLFPLTGIYGLLFLAEGVDLMQFYRPAVYGFAAVFGLALWALAVFAGKFLAPALATAAAGWTVAFFLAGQELLEKFRLAGRILAGEYSGEAVTVTMAVLFLIPVVLSLIFFLEKGLRPFSQNKMLPMQQERGSYGKNNGKNCGACQGERLCVSRLRDLRRSCEYLGLR